MMIANFAMWLQSCILIDGSNMTSFQLTFAMSQGENQGQSLRFFTLLTRPCNVNDLL